jgi:hypothetical protein
MGIVPSKKPLKAPLFVLSDECRGGESHDGWGVVVFQRKKEVESGCGALTKMGGGGTKWGEVGHSGAVTLAFRLLHQPFLLKPNLLYK